MHNILGKKAMALVMLRFLV